MGGHIRADGCGRRVEGRRPRGLVLLVAVLNQHRKHGHVGEVGPEGNVGRVRSVREDRLVWGSTGRRVVRALRCRIRGSSRSSSSSRRPADGLGYRSIAHILKLGPRNRLLASGVFAWVYTRLPTRRCRPRPPNLCLRGRWHVDDDVVVPRGVIFRLLLFPWPSHLGLYRVMTSQVLLEAPSAARRLAGTLQLAFSWAGQLDGGSNTQTVVLISWANSLHSSQAACLFVVVGSTSNAAL